MLQLDGRLQEPASLSGEAGCGAPEEAASSDLRPLVPDPRRTRSLGTRSAMRRWGQPAPWEGRAAEASASGGAAVCPSAAGGARP
jgi:hypothetical protein